MLALRRVFPRAASAARRVSTRAWPEHDHCPMFLVDAFTSTPFRGNPAGVCLLPSDVSASDRWMQSVATEMNQAETAFVAAGRQPGRFSLRWFTPVAEVELCGHATLAAATVLFAKGLVATEVPALFDTLSGELRVSRRDPADASAGLVMSFPNEPVTDLESSEEASVGPSIRRAIFPDGNDGDAVRWIGKTRFDYVVEVDSEARVRGVNPDLVAVDAIDTRGVIVTSPGENHDYVLRWFGPQVGVPEDPVTGSAHAAIGPFWGRKLGKSKLIGYQASKRGGEVSISGNGDRTEISGDSVITMEGDLKVLVL